MGRYLVVAAAVAVGIFGGLDLARAQAPGEAIHEIVYDIVYGSDRPLTTVVVIDGYSSDEIASDMRAQYQQDLARRFRDIIEIEERRVSGLPRIVTFFGDERGSESGLLHLSNAKEGTSRLGAEVELHRIHSDPKRPAHFHIFASLLTALLTEVSGNQHQPNIYVDLSGGDRLAFSAGVQAAVQAVLLPEGSKLHLRLALGYDHVRLHPDPPADAPKFDGWVASELLAILLAKNVLQVADEKIEVSLEIRDPDTKAMQLINLDSFLDTERARWLAGNQPAFSGTEDWSALHQMQKAFTEAPKRARSIETAWDNFLVETADPSVVEYEDLRSKWANNFEEMKPNVPLSDSVVRSFRSLERNMKLLEGFNRALLRNGLGKGQTPSIRPF